MLFLLILNEGHEIFDRVTILLNCQTVDVLFANSEVLVSVFGQHAHDLFFEVFFVDILVLMLALL
jgi:hypothetical protein